MTVIDNYGSPDQMFIAVFDGHGPNGAQASQFVRSVLPQVRVAQRAQRACGVGCRRPHRSLVAHATDSPPASPQRVFCEELSSEPFLPLRQGCVQTNKEVCGPPRAVTGGAVCRGVRLTRVGVSAWPWVLGAPVVRIQHRRRGQRLNGHHFLSARQQAVCGERWRLPRGAGAVE